jgi:aryl-alcohol dehydrogenase-like predicted oxidoreductase
MPTTPVTVPTTPLLTRPVPSTGDVLVVIGLGTWFDVGADRDPQRTVLAEFLRGGGRVIDSSPMYGRAEAVVGDLLAELGPPPSPPPFLATKVWTRGKARGERRCGRSAKRPRTAPLDLLQVHNLLDCCGAQVPHRLHAALHRPQGQRLRCSHHLRGVRALRGSLPDWRVGTVCGGLVASGRCR